MSVGGEREGGAAQAGARRHGPSTASYTSANIFLKFKREAGKDKEQGNAPVLKSWAISRTRRWKGSLRISSSVDFWYLRISLRGEEKEERGK